MGNLTRGVWDCSRELSHYGCEGGMFIQLAFEFEPWGVSWISAHLSADCVRSVSGKD